MLVALALGCTLLASDTTPPRAAHFAGGYVSPVALEHRGAAALYALRRELYELQVRVAEDLAFDQLVEADAKLKGLAPQALVDLECAKRTKLPTAAEAQRLLPEIRQRHQLPDDPKAAASLVEEVLKERARLQALEAYRAQLLQDHRFAMDLQPPRLSVPLRPDNPSEGPAQAPVTVVVFSDFHCEHCRSLHDTLKQLSARYPVQVRFVFKQTPLDIHPEARGAARAYLAAARKGQGPALRERLYAKADLAGTEAAPRPDLDALINQDLGEATALGITGAPALAVNGRLLQGAVPLPVLVRMVEEELRWAKR